MKCIKKLVNQALFLRIQRIVRRAAIGGANDASPREDNLFRLNNQLNVLHPIAELGEKMRMQAFHLRDISGLETTIEFHVYFGERASGLDTSCASF